MVACRANAAYARHNARQLFDRPTDHKTLKASKLRHLWPLGFLAAPLVYCSPALFGRPAWAALFVGFVGWVGHSVRRVRRGEAGPAGAQLIAGICLLDALLIAGARGGLVQVFLAVGCFGATLALQRLVKAT